MGGSDARSSQGRPILPDRWIQTLKETLTQRGWKARDLAEAIEQTDSSISKLLSNQGKVGLPTIRKVQECLKLPDPFPPAFPTRPIARGSRPDHDDDVSLPLDPEMAELVRISRRIRERDPRKFMLFLDALSTLVKLWDQADEQAVSALQVLMRQSDAPDGLRK